MFTFEGDSSLESNLDAFQERLSIHSILNELALRPENLLQKGPLDYSNCQTNIKDFS